MLICRLKESVNKSQILKVEDVKLEIKKEEKEEEVEVEIEEEIKNDDNKEEFSIKIFIHKQSEAVLTSEVLVEIFY